MNSEDRLFSLFSDLVTRRRYQTKITFFQKEKKTCFAKKNINTNAIEEKKLLPLFTNDDKKSATI